MKMKGESGAPWRMPRCGSTRPWTESLMRWRIDCSLFVSTFEKTVVVYVVESYRSNGPQLDLKKEEENPSGPGALFGWIEKSASRISFFVGSAMSLFFMSSVMHGLIAWLIISWQKVEFDWNKFW